MNGPFQVAQATIATQTSGKPPARIVKVTKPFGDQSVVVPLSYDGSVKADLSSIAGENITLVHIGEKLIILFDNKSTVTLEPFFDSNGKPLDALTVEVSPGRDLTGTEFAALFPVTEDRSILPAAGDGNGPGAQASGANFSSVGVDPLAAPNPIDLLGQEDLPNFTINTLLNQNTFINGIPSAALTGVVALDEDEIPGAGGNPGGPNDVVAPHVFSGTLNHDFGLDLAGDINFAAMNGATQTINGITVTFTWNQATHTLIANDGSHDVFEVVVTNPGTGEYTVTLLSALHHHTDALADNTEDGATFNLTFTVEDSNHTTANGTLTININDDTPVAHDSAPTDTTVVNGESPSGEGGGREGGETVTHFATIDDEGQSNGISGNAANGDDAGEATSVSGKLDIAPGADGLKAVTFTGLDGAPHVTVTADNGSHPTLQVMFVDPQTGLGTPENVTLTWQSDGNGGGTLIGTSDHFSANNPAFTLTVDAQGNYTFDVHAPFAHPLTSGGSEGSTGWEDNLHVQFTYTATDGDGDKSSATLTFNIDDDTPTVVVTTNEGEGNEGQLPLLVSLDESIGGDRGSAQSPTDGASDDTGHTQPDPHGVNPIGEMKTAPGGEGNPGGLQSLFNIVKDAGADGEKSTTYSYALSLTGASEGAGVATTLKVTDPTGTYLNDTIYLFQEDATHIVGRIGNDPNGDVAIRITLSDPDSLSGGQLVVDQYMAIDHSVGGNGVDPSGDNNNFDSTQLLTLLGQGASLGVTLTTTITDGDGDQATGSATIVLANGQSSSIGFQDDGPAPLAISAANAAANGLFFDGFTPNNDQWGTGSGINTTGTAGEWHIAASSHNGASNIQLERVGDGYRGADSPTDSVMVDMEATPGNLQLTQEIGGLTPGEVYHLTFEIGAASDADAGSAKLEVFWNGASVGTFDPTSGVMQTISIDVTAGAGNNQLTFEEIGTSGDNTGTFLANVKLADVVIIDETPGVDAGSDDTTGLGALFASVANGGPVGVDPNMDQPQYAQGKHPVIGLGTPDFGTDGPAATNPIQVGLTVSAQGVDSGLTTTDGKEIYLFVENGLVVGRFDADNDASHTPETAAFALSIDQNGNLSIAQYVSLHQPDTGSHDEGVYLNSGTVSATVTLTDGDGDHTTSSADISSAIRFEDDGPSIDAAQNSSLRDWTVDEDVLANGNDAYDVHPDTNDYTALNGKPLGVSWGADGAKALTFAATGADHPTITITDQNGAPVSGELTSGGVALTYEITTNPDGGQTLVAYKGNDHSNVIFMLTLDPDAGTTGTFSFELKGPLDHPTGEGENTLNLNFGFTATDGDNDTAASSVTIRITDDIPVVASNAANYINNGDFQAGTWSPPAWWGSSAAPTDVPGWSISGDPSLPPQNGIQFERPADGFLNLHSSTGQGMIDMGGSPGNYDLTQQIGADGTPHLVNGQQYVLELEVGAPFPTTAKMEVWWNGTLIGVIDTNVSSGQMEKFAFIVTGSGNPATDQLTFKEVGEGTAPIDGTVNGQPLQNEGYHGTYIANVKMFALNGVVDEDALNNANAHGIGDSQPGDAQPDTVVVSGNLGVKWGSDQSDVNDVNDIQDGAGSTLTGRNLTFTNATVAILGVNALTSNGDAVSFARIDNNTKLVGFVDNDHNGSYSNGDRLVFDVTLSDDGSGSFKFTLHDNLDHAPGVSENDIALQFNFTATDSDGDSANGTFAVGVDDDLPVLVGGSVVSVSVNENDILTPWSIGTSPLDGHTELFTGAAKVTGSLAGTVNFGADGPGHTGFGFADKATVIGYMESLHLFSKQTALPENGKELTYDLVGNVLTATEPGPQGNVVFTLTLNADGSFEFRLFDELVHVSGDGTNTDLRSGADGSISGINFGHIVIATDGDGDTVVLGDNFQIKIVDDVPQVSITNAFGTVQHDETAGVQLLEDTNDASVKAIFTGAGGVVNPGDDLDVAGSGAIGYAHSLLPAVDVHVNYGADYPAASQSLSLQLIDTATHKPTTDGSFQVDSGLTTTEHQKIFLVKEGDLIVGRVDVNNDGHVDQTEAAAFAIQIGQDGSLNVAQYLSLHHPNTSSNDEAVDLNNLIAAQVSVTDSDGDTATDFVEIGDKIRFDDDGPTAVNDSQKSVVEGAAKISGNVMGNDTAGADGATVTHIHVDGKDFDVPQEGGTSLIVSSTLGIYTFDKEGNWTFKPNGNLNNANGVDASFTYQLTDGDGDTDSATQTVKITDGAGPSVSSAITIPLDEEALGNANATGTNPSSTAEHDSSHSLTFTSGSDNITSIAFASSTSGISTNIDGINGADIVWTRVDDTHLIGKIGGIDAISVELTLPGFPIAAGGATGNVTVTATLLDNFPHPNGSGENTITLNGITVVAKDTDGGDTATGNITVTVKDDVPVTTQVADAISVDEANLPTDRHPGPVQGTATGIAQSGFGSLHINWGADNGDANHLAFAKDGNGHVIGPDLTSDGVKLLYEIHSPSDSPGNEQIVAYKQGDSNHTPVFSITLYESGNGGYAYVQYQNIDHSGSGTDSSQFNFNILAYDGDGDSVPQTLTINVKDDIPTAGSTSLAVDEDDLATIGNADVQDGDNLANPSPTVINGHLVITGGADGVKSLTFMPMVGHAVETTGGAAITMNHLALTYVWKNGTLYATTDAGHPSDANSAFKVTITDPSTGAYTFSLLHAVDHPLTGDSANAPVMTAFEDNLDISLTFTVTDGDNDSTSTGSLTINIDDDVPVILSPEDGSTSEANIAAATAVAHGSLGIHFGADGPAAPAAPASSGTPHTFDFNALPQGGLTHYTSGDFTFGTNEGVANTTGHTGQLEGSIITITNGTGPFTLTKLDLGFDGTSNGSQYDNITLIGTDTHGHQISVTVHLGTITPANAVGTATPLPTTFNAAGTALDGVELTSLEILAPHNNDANGRVVIDNVVLNSGSAPLTHGAVSFTDLTTAINNVTIVDSDHHAVAPAALTSQGNAVHYALLDSMTLVGYTGDTAPTAIDGANVVFSVVLSQDASHPNGNYDFTLHGPLDDLPSGVSDLNFTFNFTAKDGDGDAVSGQFSVDVKDDVPSIAITAPDESSIQLTTHDANTIGVASDVAVSAANFGSVFTTITSYGADGAGSTSSSYKMAISATPVNSHVDSGLDSHGQTIYLYDVNGTIVGSTSETANGVNAGNKIFALTVDSNGVVTLTQFAQIDHPIGSDPHGTDAPFADDVAVLGEGLVSLTRSGSVTDGDGDKASDSATIDLGGNIRFADDGPTAANDDLRTVVEGGPKISGNVMGNDTAGADGATVTHVNVDGKDFDVPQQDGTVGILGTSLGFYTFDKQGNWTFTPNNNLNNANGIDASFTYQLTDGDGDTATATQSIRIDDGADPSVSSAITLSLDEAALGNANATGTNPSSAAEQDGSHSLTFTSGSDNITSIAFASGTGGITTNLDGMLGDDIVWSRVDDTHLIGKIGNVDAISVVLSVPGLPILAGNHTGNVTVTATLLDNFPHPHSSDPITVDGIKVVATDTDGDQKTGDVSIIVNDDVPSAHADTDAAQSGQLVLGNVITDAEVNGDNGHDVAGADGIASITWSGAAGTTVTGDHGTLTFGADGSYKYQAFANTSGTDVFHYTITDGDGDTSTTTLTINVTNGEPHPVSATNAVDEAALDTTLDIRPGGEPDDLAASTHTGSNPGSGAETVSGALTLGDPNNPHVTSILGAGPPLAVGGSAVTVQGAYGLLQIDANGNYTYTLTSNDPLHSSQGTGSDGLVDTFTYTVTDGFNNTSTSTITIEIKDDVPVIHIVDPASTVVDEGHTLTGTWTLAPGADGVTQIEVTAGNETKVLHLASGTDTQSFNLDAGTLTVDADHQWHFVANQVATDKDVTFTLKAIDGDGDTSSDSQTLTVHDVNKSLEVQAVALGVVEEEHGLPGGLDDTHTGQSDLDQDTAGHLNETTNVLTGSFTDAAHNPVTGGQEGNLSFALADLPINASDREVHTSSGDLTSGGKQVYFAMDGGNLIGYVNSDGGSGGYSSSGDTKVFTFTLQSNGSYSFTLNAPVDHPDGNGENTLDINLNDRVTVKDSAGPGTDIKSVDVSVTVIDDKPVAHEGEATAAEGTTPTVNAVLVLDLSLSMGTASGDPTGHSDNIDTRLELMQAAVQKFLSSTTVTFNQITIYTFSDGAQFVGQYTVGENNYIQNAITKVNSFDQGDLKASTDYDDAANLVRGSTGNGYSNLSHPSADTTNIYFLSDGDPTSDLTNGEQTAWNTFLDQHIDQVYAIGFVGGVDTAKLEQIASRDTDVAQSVTDPNELSSTLSGALPSGVSGNVLDDTGHGAGGFGADGGHVQSITVDGHTYGYTSGGSTHVDVTTDLGGKLTFYLVDDGSHHAGDYSYTAPANVNGDQQEDIHYVLVDRDGDTAGSDLLITVKDIPNQPPVLNLNELGASGNYRDEFESSSYGNSDGSKTWGPDWTEANDTGGNNGGVSGGDIRINDDRLRFGDDNGGNDSAGAAAISREVDLTGVTSAKLTFSVQQVGADDGEDLIIEAWNGTAWQEIGRVDGDTDNGTTNFDIDLTAAQIGAFSKIQFRMETGLDDNEFYYIDNVNIAYTTVAPSMNHVASFTENGAAISIAPAGPTITDTDDNIMESAKIVLTNAKEGDLLAVSGLPSGIDHTIDTSVAGQITVNLSGNASLASYQAAIKAVTYQNTSDSPGSDDRTINVTVTDDHGNISNVATTTVHVAPTNDPFTAVADHILTNITDFSAIHIPNAALLYNDTNPDKDTLSVTGVGSQSGDIVTTGVTFDPTDPPATVEVVNTYNFVGKTAGVGASTAKYFEVDISGDNPLSTLTMTGVASSGYDKADPLSTSEYSQISSANDTRYRTTDPGSGDNAVFWAQFVVAEDVAHITGIDLRIDAIQDGGGSNSAGMEFGVWNYHTNSWQSINEVRNTSSTDTSFTFSITTHPEYYVGADGKVTLVLFNEDDNNSSGSNQRISVDYVEVKVTSDEPAPPSHFTDGSFDYTATDGTTPDTGHVDIVGTQGSTITGTASGEILLAGNGDDTLNGNGGNDYLIGGIGADVLDGGNDNDILVGGAGVDKLTGGTGADHFRFEAPSEGGDHIVDFTHGTDSIDLLLSSFSSLSGSTGTTVASTDFSIQASANAAAHADIGTAHLSYYQGTGANDPGKLYYDADGGGDANRILIAILDNHAVVTATDIHKV